MGLSKLWGRVIGIDLGTVNTVVSHDCNVVLELPTVVAYDTISGKKFFGQEALDMADYEVEGLRVVWPMVDGKINDPDAVRDLLDHVIHQVSKHVLVWNMQPNKLIVVAIACELTSVFKRQVVSATQKHADKIVLIEQPAAAALGENINLDHERCILVFDIGGGTTDAAAIARMGRIKNSSRSLAVAGNKMDEAIKLHAMRNGVYITLKFAEQIKRTIGCAIAEDPSAFVEIVGYDENGEKSVRITAEEMAAIILKPTLDDIVNFGVTWFADLCRSNPETLVRMREGKSLDGSDVLRQESMILLTGGGALLPQMNRLLLERMKIDVKVASDPLHAAAIGANRVGLNEKQLQRLAIEESNFKHLLDSEVDPPRIEKSTLPKPHAMVAARAAVAKPETA